MSCELCKETPGWVMTASGAAKCQCRAEDIAATVERSPIDGRSLSLATRALSTIGFFPREDEARMVIGDALAAMCPNVAALRYVVRRACELYQNWDRCGIQGLRQIVCYRFRPADGIEIYGTSAYPAGLPPDPKAKQPQLPAGSTLALPPGTVVSANERLDARVRLLAHAKDMNIHTRPRRPAQPPTNPNYRPIGQKEIDEAIEKRRDAAARREVFGVEENL